MLLRLTAETTGVSAVPARRYHASFEARVRFQEQNQFVHALIRGVASRYHLIPEIGRSFGRDAAPSLDLGV